MKKRILVIDDEKSILNLLRKLLENENVIVDTATNGAKGLELLNDNPPDLVISDIVMPEKEGLETINEIKKKWPNIKIIAMSGGGKINSQDYLLLAKRMGASKTLTKPFGTKEMLDSVQELLS